MNSLTDDDIKILNQTIRGLAGLPAWKIRRIIEATAVFFNITTDTVSKDEPNE